VIRLGDIWRQRLWVWVPAAVFFLANLVTLCVYQFGYGDRVASLQQDLREQHNEEKSAEADKHHVEVLLQQATINRKRVEDLYGESFSTAKRRLTGVTAEVEALAAKAGLQPKAMNFPEQEIAGYGLVKHSFVFSVTGNYVELRQFINFLELSDSFLTLESVTVVRGAVDKGAGPRAGRSGALPPSHGVNPRQLLPTAPPGLPPLPPPLIVNNAPDLNLNLSLSTLFARNGQNLDAPPPAPGRGRS